MNSKIILFAVSGSGVLFVKVKKSLLFSDLLIVCPNH